MSYIHERSQLIKLVYAIAGLFVGGKPNGELDLERIHNRASDFILEGKGVLQLAVISFRPNVEAAARIDQFGRHTNAVTLSAQSSFKHISNVYLFPNFAGICVFPFECN